LPTEALLDFELAHARARDAVHAGFDAEALAGELREAGFGDALGDILIVASRARDRMEYLLRPDLGRRLDEESRTKIEAGAPCRLAVMIGDGLSAVAPMRHAVAVLRECLQPTSANTGQIWGTQSRTAKNVTVVVANRARVALGDEIGELLGAEAVVVLIGERPGLSSPDSLGIYLTWAPRVGRTDAERNCISNVRPEGLPYAEAGRRLRYLLVEARRLQLSGVALKDDSESSGQRIADSV
jgi:ethanolamine ammonia-lyase small subunit